MRLPVEVLISGGDWVVDVRPQHGFFGLLGSAGKEKHVLPGFYHDTLGEKERVLALGKVRDFVLRRFAEPLKRISLLDADRTGYTKDEAELLQSPLPALSPTTIVYQLLSLSLRTLGSLSEA